MARRSVPLGADAERARMLAADRDQVPWRCWGPSVGPDGLPGIVDDGHGVRLDLAFGRADAGRGPRDQAVVEYHAKMPTSSFLEASVELPAGADDAPPCLLEVRFAKRAPEDIVIALTVAAGFGGRPAALELRVTLSLAAMADVDGVEMPSIRSAGEARDPGLPDDVTVLCAERPGSGTWWLVADGGPAVVEPDGECVARALIWSVEVEPGATRSHRLRLTRGHAPRSPVGVDAAATLGTRASESDAYAASLLPASRPGDLVNDAARRLAELSWAPRDAAGGPTDAIMSAVALAVADPAAARRRLLACTADRRPKDGQAPAPPLAAEPPLAAAPPLAAEPPLAAWAALRIHEMGEALTGHRDHTFLERMFQPLLEDYSGWMDRIDDAGRNALQGGLLGLDGVTGSAAGAAWMGCYSVWMLSLAIELARDDPTYQDVTVTFLDTSLAMVAALDDLGGSGVGMWDASRGVLRDVTRDPRGQVRRVPGRSTVGLVPLLAVALVPREALARLPDVAVRLNWSMHHQEALAGSVVRQPRRGGWSGDALVSLVPGERRSRALSHLDTECDDPSPTMICLLLDMIDRVRAFDTHEVPATVGDALARRLAADPSAPGWATILVCAMDRTR